MRHSIYIIAAVAVSLVFVGCSSSKNPDGTEKTLEQEVDDTILLLQARDPSTKKFFDTAIAWAVFPDIGKGAIVVGAAHGNGILYEGGRPTGKAVMTQGSIGLALGGQAYREIVFFENQDALDRFKNDTFEFSAAVSAIAVRAGAADAANYESGVAVFVMTRAGLMAEAAIGGQRFSYTPY